MYKYGRLDLNLYGSVMASYIYLKGLAHHFIANGYRRSEHDPCFFYKYGDNGSYVMAAVTLDDFLVVSSDKTEMEKLNTMLQSK